MKNNKQIVGAASGIFDIFHVGHLNFLIECKKRCDVLFVIIPSDELTYELKNKMPVFNTECRKKILANIKCVDDVLIRYKRDELTELCKKYNISVIFKGSDHTKKTWEQESLKELDANQIDVEFINHSYDNIHSSNLRDKIKCIANDNH